MSLELRLVLELGALLHDVGHFVNNKAHHRHGDYLVRNGEIPGLRGWRRDMVAMLVRYHNAKSEPQLDHKPYAGLDGARRKIFGSFPLCCGSPKNWNPTITRAFPGWT